MDQFVILEVLHSLLVLFQPFGLFLVDDVDHGLGHADEGWVGMGVLKVNETLERNVEFVEVGYLQDPSRQRRNVDSRLAD